MRILFIVVARIGDTLLFTPVIRALCKRFPNSRISVLAHPNRIDLLRNLPFIDTLGIITPSRAHWRGWPPRKHFDIAVVHGYDSSLVRYALRVASSVVSFRQADEALNRRLTRCVEPPSLPMHAVEERLLLAAAVGAPAAGRRLAYSVTPTEMENANEILRNILPRCGGPLIGFQMRSFPTKPYRDWPPYYFRTLATELLGNLPGACIVLLGGEESRDVATRLAAELHTLFPRRSANLAAALDLRMNAAVLSYLDLYIGVDTGPTHIAGALGIPMVVLYHCQHRGRYLAPLEHPALVVIEHPATDAECSHMQNMDRIGVAQVKAEAIRLLRRRFPIHDLAT